MRAGREARGMRGGRVMHGMADTDGDKAVTRAEYDAALKAHFAKADADGNGAISAAEHTAARAAMRAAHGRHRSSQ